MPSPSDPLTIQRLEQSCFYFFDRGSDCIPYHASPGAVADYGHTRIINGIQTVCSHETGAVRHFNVDAIRAPDRAEQLVIVRSTATGDIYALIETEYRNLFGWPMP
jgi:hypothetical protein